MYPAGKGPEDEVLWLSLLFSQMLSGSQNFAERLQEESGAESAADWLRA